MSVPTFFCEILLPVPVDRLFTYRVPTALNDSIRRGMRAIVPFGARKVLTGIIVHLHEKPPRDYEAKYVLDLLDEHEILYSQQFDLFFWMADYYMCTPGEVLQAALPSGLKLSSESRIQLHPAFDVNQPDHNFSEKEWQLLEQLQKASVSYSEASALFGGKSLHALLKSLAAKEAIILFEEIKEKYKPKTEKYLRLTPPFLQDQRLEGLFQELGKKPKQEAVLLKYLQAVPVLQNHHANQQGLRKDLLTAAATSPSALQTLIKNGVLEEFELIVPRFQVPEATAPPLLLSAAQEQARHAILHAFEHTHTVLLQGVTGSGKTEIYIDLIRRALASDTQVLYLLPEIALTTQLVSRLQKVFSREMGVYHSRYSANERVEIWNGVLRGNLKLVVGARSALFLPFDNLGLIIVDEEHDPSYKQHDPAPRYHARDAAVWMGQRHHAKVILGSATPSLESLYLVAQKKYGYVTLNERFGDSQLPEINLVNLKTERERKQMKGAFSGTLLKAIETTLAAKRQVIIFQNRRGYSPLVQCQECTWVPKCINCAVSLTYHQHRHALICHFCGYREDLPQQCPTCTSRHLQTLGYGTEKLEEELILHFPEANVQRMDADTTRMKSSYEKMIDEFAAGKTQILVGTQMVTKGLDFDHVGLVGIFDADRMLHFPDFRSHERAFQLMLQVSGRAGRRQHRGQVLIQTAQPQHPLFAWVQHHKVQEFIDYELRDREQHHYPPFSRLVEVTFKHADKAVALAFAQLYADQLKPKINYVRWVGPGQPMIAKIRNEFLYALLIKVPRHTGRLHELKLALLQTAHRLQTDKKFRSVRVVFDVDPV